jgi:hypothetical protein
MFEWQMYWKKPFQFGYDIYDPCEDTGGSGYREMIFVIGPFQSRWIK